jgi:DNA polymerase (family 10)
MMGGNPYRARAYIRAAQSLSAQTEPLSELVAQGRLQDIPGIGAAIATLIKQFYLTGSHPKLEQMREEIPAGVLDFLSLPGLRPDKAVRIYRELGVTSLAELEAALADNTLWKTRSLNSALQRKLKQALVIQKDTAGAMHMHRAEELLLTAKQTLERTVTAKSVIVAGDFRRGCELIRDLSLVAESSKIAGALAPVKSGNLTIYQTDRNYLGATLLRATGSDQHLAQLKARAKAKGFRLTAEGLLKGRKLIASETETDIYGALGLPFIEPELREGRGEIERATEGMLPSLVTKRDLCGILHVHTTASDGAKSLEQMADATRQLGYQYLGVTDHSQSARYAGGLGLDEIKTQHQEIDRLNETFGDGFRIFKGIESDILPDGSLDYLSKILRSFDFIVASVHGQFRLDKKAQTQRILKAVANPFVTILGHMTGRQLLRRPGYEVDIDKILTACAKHGVAVEINANPWRLDLDWRWLQRGLELGCAFSVDPDAHDTDEIENVRFGVAMARKGGLPKARVLNCLELPAFEERLEKRRRLATKRGR